MVIVNHTNFGKSTNTGVRYGRNGTIGLEGGELVHTELLEKSADTRSGYDEVSSTSLGTDSDVLSLYSDLGE